ncbi:MAG: response regulator transcription factor [Verrucomicrobiales bacterium]|nr:response regulator transcription factor [Verrucomicrobiales bacterium]
MKCPRRVILIEDHPEYRDIVNLALEKAEGLELLCQFGTAEAALRHFEQRQPMLAPEVVLLDLKLPGIDGLDAIPLLRQVIPAAKIIVITRSRNETGILRAIGAGASGYLLKSQPLHEIIESIRTVAGGGASLESNVAAFILRSLRCSLPSDTIKQHLTRREIEVLELMAEGLVKKEIADRLGIGETTVVTHVAHLYRKLDAKNAPAAIARAFRLGILPRDR